MPCSLHAVAIEARGKGNSRPIPSKGREHCAWQHGRSAKAEAPAFFEKRKSPPYMMSYPRIPLGYTFWHPYMHIVSEHFDVEEVTTTNHRKGKVPRDIASRRCSDRCASKV